MTVTDTETKNDPIDPDVQSFLDRVWSHKERLVADASSHEEGDINPIVVFADANGHPRLEFIAQRCDKRDALAASQIIAPMIESQWLAASLDSHVSSNPVNPATGQPWKQGEMQKACDEDGACSLGIITDAIVTVVARRDGSLQMVQRTYHVDEAKKEVHWVDVNSMDTRLHGEGNKLTGRIPEGFLHAITIEESEDVKQQSLALLDESGLDRADKNMHMLVTATKMTLAIVGGGAVPFFTQAEMDKHREFLSDTLSEEATLDFRKSLGPLPMLVRMKFGLDVPIEEW